MKRTLVLLIVVLFLAFSVFSQQTEKIDEFGYQTCEEWKSRLDMLGNAINQNPSSRGIILYYESQYYPVYSYRKNRPISMPVRRGEIKARVEYYREYLTYVRGHSSDQFLFVNGGFKEKFSVEFWILPSGAKMPNPEPTVDPKTIKFRKGRITRKEIECVV